MYHCRRRQISTSPQQRKLLLLYYPSSTTQDSFRANKCYFPRPYALGAQKVLLHIVYYILGPPRPESYVLGMTNFVSV